MEILCSCITENGVWSLSSSCFEISLVNVRWVSSLPSYIHRYFILNTHKENTLYVLAEIRDVGTVLRMDLELQRKQNILMMKHWLSF